MLQVCALLKLKFWIFPLITYFRYHVTEYCAVIGMHSTVHAGWPIALWQHVPDPFPQCGIGSGHARLTHGLLFCISFCPDSEYGHILCTVIRSLAKRTGNQHARAIIYWKFMRQRINVPSHARRTQSWSEDTVLAGFYYLPLWTEKGNEQMKWYIQPQSPVRSKYFHRSCIPTHLYRCSTSKITYVLEGWFSAKDV